MHLDDEQIQRMLHNELDPRTRGSVLEHVAACPTCRGRVDEARLEEAEIASLLRHLDVPEPAVGPREIAVRARARERAWLRKAAGVILAIGIAGAAYAIPGSPLRAWLNGVLDRVGHRADREMVAPLPEEGPVSSGIALAPGERFTIRFTADQDRGSVTVTLSDGAEVEVRARGGPAVLRAGQDRLTIENFGSVADYEIRIPREAPWVEIQVGAGRVLLKQRSRVLTTAPPDRDGRYIIPLTPPE